jgi:hypothetical protein
MICRIGLLLALPLISFGRAALGQALPTAEATPVSTGFSLPSTSGTLQYAASASETVTTGYYSNTGAYSATNLNGDVAYLSNSKADPFSMIFSGGHSWSTSGEPSYSFLNLGLSQVLTARRWTLVLSDSVSYLPQTPSTGLSGVPGTGDLGLNPIVLGTDTGQGILTVDSTRVTNNAIGTVQRQITGKTSLQVTGDYTILRFVNDSAGNQGLDNNTVSGSIGFTRRIDERNSLGADYGYSRFTYGVDQPGFTTQTETLDYTHKFTRQFILVLSAGPQETSTFNDPPDSFSTNVAANALLSYSGQYSNYSVSYSRGTNSGSGVVLGARSDSVRASASHRFAQVWNVSLSSAYTRSTTIVAPGAPAAFIPQTLVDAAQVSRALGRSFSAFASYTVENQSTSGSTSAIDVFSGLSQVAAVGVTYSPASIHVGHR